MGYFSGTIYAKSLYMDMQLGVILPHDSRKRRGTSALREGVTVRRTPRTLILLHGLSDNYLAWFAKTAILRYAEEYDVAVLMPEVARSWYTDMKYGRNYFTLITEELPEYAADAFNISTAPEDLMIAGLSMGGYGALKCALNDPDRFSAVGAFSSGWDITKLVVKNELASDSYGPMEIEKDKVSIFGETDILPDCCDIRKLLKKAEIPEKMKWYIACGREDFLFEDHKILRQMMKDKGIRFAETLMPGEHEWPVWDKAVQMFLDYAVCDRMPPEEL